MESENTEQLFALSITQPWLELILQGEKTIEVRSRSTRRRGMVALHAPWRLDFSAAHFYGFSEPWRMKRGRIVAVADIVDVIEFDRASALELVEEHRQFLPISGGFYGIVFDRVRALKRNLRCRGRQGFFPVPEPMAQRIKEQTQMQ